MYRRKQIDRLIQERVDQAMQRDLPRKLVNLYYSHAVDVWPTLIAKVPSEIPRDVKEADEVARTTDVSDTFVRFRDSSFLFRKRKVGENLFGSHSDEYWSYEIHTDNRLVFAIDATDRWRRDKSSLKAVTAYIPGPWEDEFLALNAQCDERKREAGDRFIEKKRRQNRDQYSERDKERLARFGLDESDSK